MSCNKCGQAQCVCGAAVIANVQLINPIIEGGTQSGGTINSAVLNDAQINGAELDCNTTGCTAGPGQCNDGVATNAFVCAEVARQIDGSNPDFCQAVDDCLSANPAALCAVIAACINGTPGIINNTIAFGVAARATTALYGVVRYATKTQFEQGTCLLAIDPCTLLDFWNSPNLSSPMWAAFTSAVNRASSTVLNNTALTGTPTAPTAAAGICTNQIATTSYICTAIANAISASNPAFCAAVNACTGGGLSCPTVSALWTPAGGNPPGTVRFLGDNCQSYTSAEILASAGGSGGGGGGSVTGGIAALNGAGVALQWTGPFWVTSTLEINPQSTGFSVWLSQAGSAGNGNTYFITIGCGGTRMGAISEALHIGPLRTLTISQGAFNLLQPSCPQGDDAGVQS